MLVKSAIMAAICTQTGFKKNIMGLRNFLKIALKQRIIFIVSHDYKQEGENEWSNFIQGFDNV